MPVVMEDLKAGRVDLAEEVDPAGVAAGAVHPGEHVRDWLDETGTTAYALAGRRAITADTALRLGAAAGTSAEMWLGLQGAYDLEVARGRGMAASLER